MLLSLRSIGATEHWEFFFALKVPLCTDNAAMIAWAGVLRLQQRDGVSDPLDQPIRSKWPIDEID